MTIPRNLACKDGFVYVSTFPNIHVEPVVKAVMNGHTCTCTIGIKLYFSARLVRSIGCRAWVVTYINTK